MNIKSLLILSTFLLFSSTGKGQTTESYRLETSVAGFIPLPGSGRQVYNFNPGWRFFKGDIRGAEAVDFDDRSWEVVSTPHTVELMPDELMDIYRQAISAKDLAAAGLSENNRAALSLYFPGLPETAA